MLEIGNGALTDAEGRSQLALWCIMRAPLLSGTDVSRATPATIKTLTSTEVLAVNQDALTVQGMCMGRCLGGTKPSNPLIWAGPLSKNCAFVRTTYRGGAVAVAAHTLQTLSISALFLLSCVVACLCLCVDGRGGANAGTVATVINTGSGSLTHTLNWGDIGLPSDAKMSVRDLWAEQDKGTASGSFAVTVATSHDNAMLKLCPA
jgi:hypothetical protein